MIIESIVSSISKSGIINFAPFGIKKIENFILISPFIPSTTLNNLRNCKIASVNYVDKADFFVRCILKKIKFQKKKCNKINCYYLTDSVCHDEVEVLDFLPHKIRPTFKCKIIHSSINNKYKGINRANNAIIEACILASRIKILDRKKIYKELEYLSMAIKKTSGKNELKMWNDINNFIKTNISSL